MTFAHPELLALLPLALLMALALLGLRRRLRRALEAWATPGLWPRLGWPGAGRSAWPAALLLGLVVASCVTALAQPRWGEREERVQRQGLDLVFVLDTSLSMAARDVRPDRSFVAATLLRRLAAALPGIRVALLQTEGEGQVLTPLTEDVAVLDLLLDGLSPASLPVPGTRLAPALEQAARLLPRDGGRGAAIVLLSDGEDHGGGIETAARHLAGRSIPLFALGVGTQAGAPLPLPHSEPGEYKRGSRGEVVVSRLHEEVLEEAARATGGLYLRATDAGVDLQPLVRALRDTARGSESGRQLVHGAERFQWPLGLAAAALAGWLAAPLRPHRKERHP